MNTNYSESLFSDLSTSFTDSLLHSSMLMQSKDTALLIIDVQERLIQAVDDQKQIVWNIRRLIDAANVLSIEMAATEQYPQRLGHTIELVKERIVQKPYPKMSFSCVRCAEVLQQFRKSCINKICIN